MVGPLRRLAWIGVLISGILVGGGALAATQEARSYYAGAVQGAGIASCDGGFGGVDGIGAVCFRVPTQATLVSIGIYDVTLLPMGGTYDFVLATGAATARKPFCHEAFYRTVPPGARELWVHVNGVDIAPACPIPVPATSGRVLATWR